MRRWFSTLVICAAAAACDDNTDVNAAPHDAGTEAASEGGADAGKDVSDAAEAGD
jgi:hypothetical protein